MAERTNHVLIDYENVQPEDLELLKLGPFKIKLFLGPNQLKLPASLVISMQQLGDNAAYIPLTTAGKNALDFHIAYYIGQLSAHEPNAYFHIISKDSGFDPLVEHLKSRKIAVKRSPSIAAMPMFHQAAAQQAIAAAKATSSVNEQLARVISNLKNRPSGKPASEKTLLNTLHALFNKQLNDGQIKSIYNELVKRGVVRSDGNKLSYSL